jgi:hypothetical protein
MAGIKRPGMEMHKRRKVLLMTLRNTLLIRRDLLLTLMIYLAPMGLKRRL